MGQEGRKYRARTLQEAAERGKVQLPIPEIHEKAMNTARSKGGSKVWNEFKDGTTRDKLDKKGGFEGAVWDWDFLRGERENKRQLQEVQSLLLLEAGRKTVSIDL